VSKVSKNRSPKLTKALFFLGMTKSSQCSSSMSLLSGW
jgi:hypothetical protein